MLAIFVLSLLIFTQTILASSSDDDWLDLRDQSHLLEAEKRYADQYAASMRVKKTVTNTPDNDPQCSPANLGLIIDASRSIGEKNFKKGQQFLADLVDKFDVGTGRNQDRIAGVSFSEGVHLSESFNFDNFTNNMAVKQHLLNMYYFDGLSTETAMAIEFMRNLQVPAKRTGARQVQLVLTDGDSNRPLDTIKQSGLTKEANITVVAVGVGSSVHEDELETIAGDVKTNVHKAESYDDLNIMLIEEILLRLCKPCGLKFPADINFVFSAATMGWTKTRKVTSFINKVIKHKKLKQGFQFGVVSGDCPDDEGFKLNQYNSVGNMSAHLERYDRNNLPYIVQRATATRFTAANGARSNAAKKAVIFVGQNKVNKPMLKKAIKRMLALDVQVFASVSNKKLQQSLKRLLRSEVTFLSGSTDAQIMQLVEHLCPSA